MSTLRLLLCAALPLLANGQSAPWYQTDFPAQEFQARWGKVFDKIGKDAVAVVQGVSLTNGFLVPRQTNEFYYLCGVETPHSYLLLDGRRRRVVLYLPPRNPRLESAEGKVLSAADGELAKSLTAAGTANIWNMHYYRNLAPLRAGDLVLMDYAPEYHYYTSDIGRMFPVNGRFDARQRELLGFVTEYRNAILARIRPGVTAGQIMDEAKQAMESVFARTKFSKPVYEQAARRLVETGGGVFSHPVGMAVHDDGEYIHGPLKPGHVISIDPQLRVPEENLYIRCEDTIGVTAGGMENFTARVPAALDDIEKLVGAEGVVLKVPPEPSRL